MTDPPLGVDCHAVAHDPRRDHQLRAARIALSTDYLAAWGICKSAKSRGLADLEAEGAGMGQECV